MEFSIGADRVRHAEARSGTMHAVAAKDWFRGAHEMPVLQLKDLPADVYERLRQMAAAHNRTPEAEAVDLLRQGLRPEPPGPSQADLLAELRRRSFRPPPGTPDSLELLREDRGR
jgi:plasmid stability protein